MENLAIIAVLFIFIVIPTTNGSVLFSEGALKNFFDNEYDQNGTYWCTKLQEARWNFQTDLNNKEKEKEMVKTTLEYAEYSKRIWEKYFKNIKPDDYTDPDLKRRIMFAKMLGKSVLDNEKLDELTVVTNTMTEIYSRAKICPYRKKDCEQKTEGLNLDKDISKIFATSRDFKELSYLWKAWRNQTGAKMSQLFERYVNLSNEASVLNGYKDTSEEWHLPYELPDFVKQIDDLWFQVEPLYNELHKYVSLKLKGVYGDALDISDGLLPAHILGNMWAQDWSNIEDIVKPFPKASHDNLTEVLLKKRYTARKMFETSDDFYKSMGLLPNDISYNTEKGAIIQKPTDGRQVVCHASACDFCDRKNFRYFVAHITQFQFYKSLCIAAGQYDPKDKSRELHKCDFYESKAAGDKLRAGLSLGLSKHWSVAMKAITGQEKMDASPLLEYFEPLYDYLKEYNNQHKLSA